MSSDTSYSYDFPCYRARYDVALPLKRYADNPLIAALGAIPDITDWQHGLTKLPEFDKRERELNRSLRRLRLEELKRFMAGIPRAAQLGENVHASMIESYVGRMPFSQESNRIGQALYNMRFQGRAPGAASIFKSLSSVKNTAQFTTALIGTPGGGKSFSLAHIASMYSPCIHHEKHDIWQIPVLQIEMPTTGVSVTTLAHAILLELDERFPNGNYFDLYLKPKANAEQRFLNALFLMRIHCVGTLVVDEAQNQEEQHSPNAHLINMLRRPSTIWSGRSPLTRLLITASNKSQIPLLLAGTAELRQLLGRRLSGLRRLSGPGMTRWGPLEVVTRSDSEVSEYDILLRHLWRYQWTQHHERLTMSFRNHLHYFSYGIPDIVVKMFSATQWAAIRNGSERITTELLKKVAEDEFKELMRVTAAMRARDKQAMTVIAAMDDLAAEFEVSPVSIHTNSAASPGEKERKAKMAAALKEYDEDPDDRQSSEEALSGKEMSEDERHQMMDLLRKYRAARKRAAPAGKGSFMTDQVAEATLADLGGL